MSWAELNLKMNDDENIDYFQEKRWPPFQVGGATIAIGSLLSLPRPPD